jgi:hypothetical protein
MDRIIKITIGIFIVLLVAFIGFAGYSFYIENTYRNSLTSTFTYNCIITTDSLLANVTLFIPVPADPSGNSPVIGEYSAQAIRVVPSSWKTELYDTGKATLVKITTPSLAPGTTTLYTNITAKGFIDTRSPLENSPVFRPVQELKTAGTGQTYVTTVFADYQAPPGAAVTITSSLIGRNDWKIFGPGSNEYRTGISVQMSGAQNDWNTANGYLDDGIGSYDAPVLPK